MYLNKFLMVLTKTLLIVLLISCESKIQNESQINNYQPQFINIGINYLNGLNPTNINNIVDSCGFYHNLILYNLISEHNIFSSDTNQFWIYLDDLFNAFGNNQIMNSNTTINSAILNHYIDSINGLSHNYILNNCSYNDYCKTKLNSLFQILYNHKDTINTTIDTVINIINEIKQWESSVINELNFYTLDTSNHQAMQLLISSSIMRYSLCFWITAINDSLTPLRTYLTTSKIHQKVNKRNNKISLTFLEIYGIGAALYLVDSDVDGAIAGSQRPKLDENGLELKNPDGTPVMETLRGTEGAALGSARAAKRIGGWLMDLVDWIINL